MSYFKIGDVDYSMCVNSLKVKTVNNYTALTNASGDTVVDYINAKREITVGVIPLNADIAATMLSAISEFNVNISFLNPNTNELEENVNVIIPESEIDYYTIQAGNVKCNAYTLNFIEL